MIQKKPDIQLQYAKDADLMATKSRFGFFTMYPSHTAAITDYAQKKANKDLNGKVINQTKGIYSGSKSAKVLPKTCFSQFKSTFVGCPYVDPGKPQRQKIIEEKKKWQHKQLFKPARLEKSLIASSYQYKCTKPDDRTKMHINQDGKVITESPNICSSPLSKLQFKKNKYFRYTEDLYGNQKIKRKQQLDQDLAQRGEPFKAGNPVKDCFSNNKNVFDDTSDFKKTQITQQSEEKYTQAKIKHESSFKPSSGYFTKYNGLFNKITYKQEGNLKERAKTAEKIPKNQSFKSMNKYYNSRPCPSVSTSKMNLMRCIR